MPEPAPIVYVVDDDPDVLKAIERLLESIGLSVATFSSPHQFLEGYDRSAPGCLVLDLAMPGLNGLELQRALRARGERAADRLSDRPRRHRGERAGDEAWRGRTSSPSRSTTPRCSPRSTRRWPGTRRCAAARVERERIAKCLATLTERERQVLEQIVAGRLNKQIAAELGTVEKTIKFHRGNLMRKMGVRVVADLVKLAERAGVGSTPGT